MSIKLSDCTSPWASVNWKHILHLTIQIDNKCDNVPLATCRFQSIKLFPITSSANCYLFETNHPTQFLTVLRKELHAFARMFRFWSSETEWFGLLSLSFCYKLTSCGALWEAVLLLTTRAVNGKKNGDDYWGLPDISQRATLETALLAIDWKTIYTHGNKLQYVKISLK